MGLSERCGLIKSQSKLCLKFLSLKKMSSSLNRAHWLHRQAEKATRKGRVEEAVQYHKEAADILNELLQNILDEKVAESVRLQAQLHEKERLILRHQRKKAEKVYRDLAHLKQMAANGRVDLPGDGDSLQLSIYRKFEETENLITKLKIQEDNGEP